MKTIEIVITTLVPTFIFAFIMGIFVVDSSIEIKTGQSATGVNWFPDFYGGGSMLKENAVIKPLGYKIISDKRVKENYIVMETLQVQNGYDDLYEFMTLNDTKTRQVTLHDARLNVGDLVVFEQITQIKDCNLGVQLKVPDFESIWFENIPTKNFTEDKLPKYYTDKYDIKIDFSTCKTPLITKWNSVYRNGELVEKMQLERTGYEI